MQEHLLAAARESGADVWRGSTVRGIELGETPAIIVERGRQVNRINGRLIACADGRSSMGRSWGGFSIKRGQQKLLGAGLVFDNWSGDEETTVSLINPSVGRDALVVPQREGRVRAYLMYETDLPRLQGDGDVGRFIEECIKTGMPPAFYEGLRPGGPLASFDIVPRQHQ